MKSASGHAVGRGLTSLVTSTRAVSSGTSSPVIGCGFMVRPSQRVTGTPPGPRSSIFVIVGQQRVGVPDVVEVAQDRLGRRRGAHRAEMPLEIADPQHQLRHRHGARVLLQAEELVRIDARAGQRQPVALAGHRLASASSTSPSSRFISSIVT